MRQSFDEKALDELTASIREFGVIQPVAVVRDGKRYRVAAGHRRCIAAVHAGLEEIPAVIFPENTPLEEVIKVHENTRREKVNPADEAKYFRRLYEEKCGLDTNKLAAMVGEKREYVEGRLNLLRGYPEVLEALERRQIGVSAAIEFNKYKDAGHMRAHLKSAIDNGAKATEIQRWRTDLERMFAEYPQQDMNPSPLPGSQSSEARQMACCVCGESHDPYNLEFMYIHRGGPCKKLLERSLGNLAGSNGAE